MRKQITEEHHHEVFILVLHSFYRLHPEPTWLETTSIKALHWKRLGEGKSTYIGLVIY